MLLAGPGAGIEQIDDFFAQRLNLPAMQVDPVATLALEVNDDLSLSDRSGLGIALGLGLREIA